MLILTIRTDKPEAEIGLYENDTKLAYETWQAHRVLAETIHQKIHTLLTRHHKNWQDLEAIICYKGPGSFTGLRIGLTVGNALSFGLAIPIIATDGTTWIEQGQDRVHAGENDLQALPEYGAPVHITMPRR